MISFRSLVAAQRRATTRRLLSHAQPKTSAQQQAEQEAWRLRDHRHIGAAQKLFFFHPASPGSLFILPHGMRIINKVRDVLRNEYARLGYDEVETPLLFDKSIWEKSGHWQNYKSNMYAVTDADMSADISASPATDAVDNPPPEAVIGLKPMNCPAHCLVYDSEPRSYRDLPIRFADFSSLHRNELSGTLSGLTRLRHFHQDDAHIFCTEEQLESEIRSTLALIRRMYRVIFRFNHFELVLSTRPSSYMGAEEMWNKAEQTLKRALDEVAGTGESSYRIDEGGGAFYGPKIDLYVQDAHKRKHQLGTVQLDFQLPLRFNLGYTCKDGTSKRPAIIHRAILGSLERFWGVWMESCDGHWPVWCSPRHVAVVPVTPDNIDYAQMVVERIRQDPQRRFYVDIDVSDGTLNKKIRQAQQLKYNYVLVLGERETRDQTVAVRQRGSGKISTMQTNAFYTLLCDQYDSFE